MDQYTYESWSKPMPMWLSPATRRGRHGFSLAQAHGSGEMTMDGNTVYIFDRKDSSIAQQVIADLNARGVHWEMRDVEAFPQYEEQADRVYRDSPESKAADGTPLYGGHSWPLVYLSGHTMSGYSPAGLDALFNAAGMGSRSLFTARMQTNLIRYGALGLGVLAVGAVGYAIWRRSR